MYFLRIIIIQTLLIPIRILLFTAVYKYTCEIAVETLLIKMCVCMCVYVCRCGGDLCWPWVQTISVMHEFMKTSHPQENGQGWNTLLY